VAAILSTRFTGDCVRILHVFYNFNGFPCLIRQASDREAVAAAVSGGVAA